MTITKISGAVTPIAEADKINEIIDNMATGVVWGSITGTMSDQTDLQTALNAAVHKTGDETIKGIKTFEGNNIIKNTYPFVEISNANLTKGTNPASMQYAGLLFEDKNADGQTATRLGDLVLSVDSSGNVKNAFKAWKYNGTQTAQISVIYPITGDPYATAPTPTEDTTASTQIDTVGARNTKLANYALNSDVVTLTGAQTITDTKTFARAIDQSAASWTAIIPMQDTNTDFTVNPSYNKDYYLIQMKDKNGKLNSWITSQYLTNGESATYVNVRARNTANTGNVDGSIGIIAKRDGTIVTKSHTPPTADNSTQIATTAYVNNKHQVVSTLPASPDSNVYYYIPE